MHVSPISPTNATSGSATPNSYGAFRGSAASIRSQASPDQMTALRVAAVPVQSNAQPPPPIAATDRAAAAARPRARQGLTGTPKAMTSLPVFRGPPALRSNR